MDFLLTEYATAKLRTAVGFCCAAVVCSAATVDSIWNGGDGDWNVPGNWSTEAVPASGAGALIGSGAVTISTGATNTADYVRIGNVAGAGATLTLEANAYHGSMLTSRTSAPAADFTDSDSMACPLPGRTDRNLSATSLFSAARTTNSLTPSRRASVARDGRTSPGAYAPRSIRSRSPA